MASSGESAGGDLDSLDLGALRQAMEIYLRVAYPDGPPPPAVQRRTAWADETGPTGVLNAPPFERGVKRRQSASPVFSLRLGNARYPHMKLQVEPWPNPAGFMLSVNTHDQVLGLDADAEDFPAFRELQAENQRLKEAIETAWDLEGLPTFLRYLREYIESRGGAGQDAPPADLA